MKVWIDKQGGTHYHKADCEMIGKPHHYEEIEHQLRKIPAPYRKMFGIYANIVVDHKIYEPCPVCFGHGERK